MRILGIAAPFGHDHSAAILVDGKVIAAAEEERFTRKKHADGQLPVNAIKYCLTQARLSPDEIDFVAHPWSFQALRRKRLEYFMRTIFSKPSRAYKKFFRSRREWAGQMRFVNRTLAASGFDISKVKIKWVEHHLAHVASSFYFSGFKDAAVMSIDAGGEVVSTLLGYANEKGIFKIKEIISPDSLGEFYATMTDYLGFQKGDGEYKVMGMAPYGDAARVNLGHIVGWDENKKSYRCNEEYVWVNRSLRFNTDKVYSRKMVKEFGPERQGDGLSEPYIHIAAATQKTLEAMTVRLIDYYLKDILEKHGNLCFAGGCALNVALNRILLEKAYIKRLWVQPAASDCGASLGAAAYIAAQFGEVVEPMRHAYLGPDFSNNEIETVLKDSGFDYRVENDICAKVASLLHSDNIVGWFQGRMEWGPRALGNRSILGNPTIRGTADRINSI
ncbi:MAG: carbamoyltransferase N-terminal domain-containing protein, partial [Candidatus Omnitrophota bacterium]